MRDYLAIQTPVTIEVGHPIILKLWSIKIIWVPSRSIMRSPIIQSVIIRNTLSTLFPQSNLPQDQRK